MRTMQRQDAGFTLMELMIVMMIIGILMLIAVPRFTGAINTAREAVLKEDLNVMREAIDSYTVDKQKAPQSLDDLIADGYLKTIPQDPFTYVKDSWVTETGDALHSLDQTDPASMTFTPARRSWVPMGNRIPTGKENRDSMNFLSCSAFCLDGPL